MQTQEPHHTALQVTHQNGPLEPTAVTNNTPKPGWVAVKIMASGVCGADLSTAAGQNASPEHPVTPGHEIAGIVDDIGLEVTGWNIGDRVSVGWFGGSCGVCHACRSGNQVHCEERKIPGISYPGGWADRIVVPVAALARIPEGMDFITAAPMRCAGVTTFNAVRHAGLRAGSRVAVIGIGGLGHLAIQFASCMGFETIAINRSSDKRHLALQLGAHQYLDCNNISAGEALQQIGGADHIISTVPSTEAISDLWKGLRTRGRMTLIGVDTGNITVPVPQLVMKAQVVAGHLTGNTADIEECLNFAVLNGISPMTEIFELGEVNQALELLRGGRARFRIVLTPEASTRD